MSERCDGNDPRLAALVDGEMRGDDRRRMASHVLLCRECAAEVGHMVAEKVLLERGKEAARTGPPRELWRDITRELDRVDGVQTALAWRPSARASRLPALVAVGTVLILAALGLSIYVNRPANVTGQLLAVHGQALDAAGISLYSGPGMRAVATSYEQPSFAVRWRAIERLNGAFAVHRVGLAGRLPVSVISAPADAVPTIGMERVVVRGREMFVGCAPQGTVVAVFRQGMATVLIANTTPEDLVPLAAKMSTGPLATFP